MARIPKYEQSTDFRPAMQPFSSGDGYEAPGRGLQRVGQGIAALGQGIASLQGVVDRDDEFNAKLAMLKLSNEQDLDDMQSRQTFNPDRDDPDQYAPGRMQRFQERANSALGTIKSDRARRNAMLHIERLRGVVGERATQFGGQQKQQLLFRNTEQAITGEFDKLGAFQPVQPSADAENQAGYMGAGSAPATPDAGDQYMARFERTLRAAEAIIQDMPTTPQAKQQLSKHAASLAMAALGRKQDAWPAVEQWLSRQREQFGEATPAAPAGAPIPAASGSGPDYRGQRGPAAIRYNNPGAMWPGTSSRKFGAVDVVTLNDHQRNKIAVFPDAVSGAAAQFDLLERKYTGKTLTAAIRMWSGGNSSAAYAAKVAAETGLTPDSVLTKDMIRDPRIAIPIARSMASMEAGRKEYPLEPGQWAQAHQMAFGKGEAPVAASQTPAPAVAGAQVRVAQAPTGTATDATPLRPAMSGIRSELTESLLKAAPAMKEGYRRQVDGMISKVEEMAAKGQQAPDEMVADLQARAAKSGDAGLMQRVGLLPQVLAVSRAENMASPKELTEVIQQVEAAAQRGPLTPQQSAQLDHLKKKREETEKAISKDPYEHSTRVGLLPAPVPEIKPGLPPSELQPALEARAAARTIIEGRMGQPVPLLQGGEQQAIKDYLMSPEQGTGVEKRANFLRAMYDALGPQQMMRDLKEVFGKDAPELAGIGWLQAQNASPDAIKDALRGMDLIKSKGFESRMPPDRAVQQRIDGSITASFRENPEALNYAKNVAKLIYEARAEQAVVPHATAFSGKNAEIYDKALQEAMGRNEDKVGGRTRTYGGVKDGVVLPTWLDAKEGFDAVKRVLRWGDLPAMVSTPMPNTDNPDLLRMPSEANAERAMDAAGVKAPVTPVEFGEGPINTPREAPEPKGQFAYMPGTPDGKQVTMADIRAATPVWVGGAKYLLRTGFDGRGDPIYIGVLGQNSNYVLDLDRLRPLLENRTYTARSFGGVFGTGVVNIGRDGVFKRR